MVYADRPWRVRVHGHAGVRFLNLVNGGRKPVGPDCIRAVNDLCDRAGVPPPKSQITVEQAELLRKREARRQVLDAVSAHAQEALRSERGRDARAYLANREALEATDTAACLRATWGTLPAEDRARLHAEAEAGDPLAVLATMIVDTDERREPCAWRIDSRRLDRELWLVRDQAALDALDADRAGLPVLFRDDVPHLVPLDDLRLHAVLDTAAESPGTRVEPPHPPHLALVPPPDPAPPRGARHGHTADRRGRRGSGPPAPPRADTR